MAKTDFANGTVVTSDFLDSIFQTTVAGRSSSGHVHDGGTTDGHATKVELTAASDVDGMLPRANMVPPRGYLDGGVLSYVQDSDAWNLGIGTVHACLSSDGLMATSGAATKLVIAADGSSFVTWATGNNAGGVAASVATAGPSANQWLHVFLIRNPSTEAVDFLLDTSLTAANAPSGYTQYRRIGSVQIEDLGGGDFGIRQFKQYGEVFLWEAPVVDYVLQDVAVDTDVSTFALSVPPDVVCAALLNVVGNHTSTWRINLWDGVLGSTYMPNSGFSFAGAASQQAALSCEILVDTSRQIYGSEVAAGTSSDISIGVRGWRDQRGRNA